MSHTNVYCLYNPLLTNIYHYVSLGAISIYLGFWGSPINLVHVNINVIEGGFVINCPNAANLYLQHILVQGCRCAMGLMGGHSISRMWGGGWQKKLRKTVLVPIFYKNKRDL